jgi:hypothetical protein
LAIYPEGTTANGRYISSFKSGAFYSLYPVKSILFDIKSHKNSFPVCASAMDILLHMIITFTFFYVEIDAYELPVFAPNEYLYSNYSHLGREHYSIYSEAIRLIWSEFLNCPINDGNLDVKLEYKSRIVGRVLKDS